jgi:hypothetical protein
VGLLSSSCEAEIGIESLTTNRRVPARSSARSVIHEDHQIEEEENCGNTI